MPVQECLEATGSGTRNYPEPVQTEQERLEVTGSGIQNYPEPVQTEQDQEFLSSERRFGPKYSYGSKM